MEFCGAAVRALSMQERMTLSNMSAELGAQAGLIAPDDDHARLAGRARRAATSTSRRGTPTPARRRRATLRRRDARAAGRRAAQPGQRARR